MMLIFERLESEKISPRDVADINALLAQLSELPEPLTLERVRQVAAATYWLVARDMDRCIKGMATLGVLQLPKGNTAYVHDVVVDESCRGQGTGEGLVLRLIEAARRCKLADWIELTSRPSREAANRLYQKLGFGLRETNCYTLRL